MRSISLIIFIALVSSASCFAQFVKGDIAIGGSATVDIQKTPASSVDDYRARSTSVNIQPDFRFFINERVSLGANIGYSTYTSNVFYPNSQDYTYRSNSVHFALAIRRYAVIREGFLFSIGSRVSYGTGASKQSSAPEKSKYHSFQINANPSLHFFPSKNWSLEGGLGSIGFARSVEKDLDRKSNRFNFSLGNIYFGVAYYLRK